MQHLRSRHVIGTHVALVVVQIAFACGAVEGKLAMAPLADEGGGVAPTALAMSRMLGASLFFQALAWRDAGRPRLVVRDHIRLAGLSVLGVVLNQGLYLAGLHLTSAFSAALLGATIPIFTAALSVLLGQERGTPRMAVGLALALGGVLFLTGIHAVDRGALIVAVNCLSYSLYIVLGRGTIMRLGALHTMAWVFTWGALIFAPIGVRDLVVDARAWTPRAWIFVAFIVAVPTIVAYLANAWALGRSTASLVTIYIYLQPLFAALLAWAQLGQGLSARMLGATALILVGVAIVTLRRAEAPRPVA